MRRLLLPAVAVVMLGCGGGPVRPDLSAVSGNVLVNGKPADGAMVSFHPASSLDWRAQRSFGVTKADGSFRAGTFNPEDGVPPGEYRVTVVWTPASRNGDPGPDRLTGKYADPQKPVATVTVKPGENALDPFKLTTP